MRAKPRRSRPGFCTCKTDYERGGRSGRPFFKRTAPRGGEIITPRYVFRYTLDEGMIADFYKTWPPVWFKAMAGILSAGMILMGIDEFNAGYPMTAFACAALALLPGWLPLAVRRNRKILSRRLLECYPQGRFECECIFEEDAVRVKNLTSGGDGQIEYIHFRRINESKLLFLLETKARQVIFIPKEGMDAGQQAQFTKFLFSHCQHLKNGLR